ncbi:MAG TPA: LysR substrate-binding domain-containing protein [Acidimicrobiales bacterium]|jgi:DNA-binding transcriptional LysR family regulator
MDLRRLGYLLAVVDHGGFTAAAKATFVSQPALSLAVKELEEELRAPLLYRLGRGVRPTPAGEALIGPARQALRDVETARAAVASVAGLESGSLALASLPTLAADPLAGLVGRFRAAHPGVVVDLSAPEDDADLIALLRDGQCELGLAEGVSLPDELTTHELLAQELSVILPPGTIRASRHLLVEELEQVPLIAAPKGTSSRRILDEAFASVGLVPRVVVLAGQREAILPLVLAGAGAAMVPEPLAEQARRLGAVVAVPRPSIRRHVVLAHRPGALAPAARRFLDLALG